MSRRRDPNRIKRDCQCPRANHQHGTHLAYLRDGCRCDECTDAVAADARQRYRREAYGIRNVVPHEEVVEHIQRLHDAGMTWRQIADAAGVALRIVGKVREPGRKRIRKDLAEKLMAVTYTEAHRTQNAHVPILGPSRRLQALATQGWGNVALSEETGIPKGMIWKIQHAQARYVFAKTAETIAEVYERLADVRAVGRNTTYTRNTAAKHGWVPPAMWDDIDRDPWPVDNQDAHEVLLCLRDGMGAQEVAESMGYTHPKALWSTLGHHAYRKPGSVTARMAYSELGKAMRETEQAA